MWLKVGLYSQICCSEVSSVVFFSKYDAIFKDRKTVPGSAFKTRHYLECCSSWSIKIDMSALRDIGLTFISSLHTVHADSI